MLQEILVAIIGIGVVAYLIYKVYDLFFTGKKKNGICGCSNCHCNISKKNE